MDTKYLKISWHQYQTITRKLAAAILSSNESYDEIVAISRGGLTLGHLLTDFLQIPISIISIQSYSDIKKQGKAQIIAKLPVSIRGKNILLVDDVSDSGKTFIRALTYLKTQKAASITTVSMLYKPWSKYKPDYFIKRTKSWIIFPYETTEMILLITKNLEKKGESKAAIQQLLKSLNYSNDEIAFVRKHHAQ